MSTFVNRYTGTIDDKGRIVLPAEFKKAVIDMGLEKVVLEKNYLTTSIDIHPEKTWIDNVANLKKKLNPQNKKHALFLQKYFKNFFRVSIAPNGRINIPNEFLEFAHLKKSVEFIGMEESISMVSLDNPAREEMNEADFMDFLDELGKKDE